MTDDWEPLPEDQCRLHPGELAGPVRRLAGPAVTPPELVFDDPDPVAKSEADPAAAAAAERALAALKARLLQAKPSTSLIAEVQHRQLREERKRKVAAMTVLAAAQRQVAPAPREPKPAAAVEVEIDTRVADVDPRETEPWFQELPKKEQERLRTHWWHERHRNDDAGVKLRRRLGRAVGYGAGMFLGMSLLLVMLLGSFSYIPILTAAGGLAAGVAELLGGGRFRYGAAGGLAFVLALGPEVLLQPLSMMALMLLTYGMATLGMDGEMRKTGGFGDR